MVNPSCNGKSLRLLFDTGASQSIIGSSTVATLGLTTSVRRTATALRFTGAVKLVYRLRFYGNS